ncbi:Coenzyme PQQ synthesis protein D [compost metagenome]
MTDGTRTLQECAATLQSEFDAPADVIERDVMQFATELADIGVVAVVETAVQP